jgi:hypothetical protein
MTNQHEVYISRLCRANTMRKVLKSVLLIVLLLNLEEIWELCGACCTSRIGHCVDVSGAIPHCESHCSPRSIERPNAVCHCQFLDDSIETLGSQPGTRELERVSAISWVALQLLIPTLKGPFDRSTHCRKPPDSAPVSASSQPAAPLRI